MSIIKKAKYLLATLFVAGFSLCLLGTSSKSSAQVRAAASNYTFADTSDGSIRDISSDQVYYVNYAYLCQVTSTYYLKAYYITQNGDKLAEPIAFLCTSINRPEGTSTNYEFIDANWADNIDAGQQTFSVDQDKIIMCDPGWNYDSTNYNLVYFNRNSPFVCYELTEINYDNGGNVDLTYSPYNDQSLDAEHVELTSGGYDENEEQAYGEPNITLADVTFVNVAKGNATVTNASGTSDEGTWGVSDQIITFTPNDPNWAVTTTYYVSLIKIDSTYKLTIEIQGHKDQTGSTETLAEHVFVFTECEFVSSSYEDQTSGITYVGYLEGYCADLGYPAEEESKVILRTTINPTSESSVNYPGMIFNDQTKKFEYWDDEYTQLGVTYNKIDFYQYNQGSEYNEIRIEYGIIESGAVVRIEEVVLYNATVINYPSGATVEGAVAGEYIEEINTEYTDINLITVGDGYNYFPALKEIIYYQYNDDTRFSLVFTNAYYEMIDDEQVITVEYQLGADGQPQTFHLSGQDVSSDYDSELERYILVGCCDLVINDYSDEDIISVYSPVFEGNEDYNFGWNYNANTQTLVYYDEDYGGVYRMSSAVNNILDKEIILTYWGHSQDPEGDDYQKLVIDYERGGGYDESENTVSGEAPIESTTAEFITVNLTVEILEANTWIYTNGRMYWKDINSLNIDTNDLDIKKFVYVTCEENTDNEYAEIDYTYTNAGTTINLPRLTLNGAYYSPDGDIYYVSGSYYGREVEIEIPESKWKTREYGTYDYEVIFDGNGATSGSTPTDEFNITEYSYDYVLPECGYKREGYKFIGWGFQPDALIKFQPGTTRNITNGTTTFYALWEASSEGITFKISFNPNGGIGYMEPLTVNAGRNQVPECGFTRPGYIFDCWAVGSADSSIKVNAGSYVTVDGNYDLYALWLPGVEAETPISNETITNITTVIGSSDLDLSDAQQNQIKEYFKEENRGYVSEEAGTIVYEALSNTSIDKSDDDIAAAQQDLVVTVVVTGFAVDSTKASSISGAQEIDKALPENANFSVESEIDEFYQRQMYELFGGEQPSRFRKISRVTGSEYEIDTDVSGMEKDEALDHLENEQSLYENMVDYVDTGVEHMGKAALKLRVCSGESVTVQVKSYVTEVKVSSYREFDKAAADKEFVEAVYKAILLSMQHEVISILESEHKPSNNAEKEAQYQKELDAVKDLETFEIMVTEVLRQKYVELTGEQIDDVDDFKPIYWEIFTAWALDQPSPYNITLEELTQTTIEQSKNRAGTFIVHSDLSKAEWGFIAGIAGGAALLISAAAIIPTVLAKKRKKEGRE